MSGLWWVLAAGGLIAFSLLLSAIDRWRNDHG